MTSVCHFYRIYYDILYTYTLCIASSLSCSVALYCTLDPGTAMFVLTCQLVPPKERKLNCTANR
jgi:hypothetical protein